MRFVDVALVAAASVKLCIVPKKTMVPVGKDDYIRSLSGVLINKGSVPDTVVWCWI